MTIKYFGMIEELTQRSEESMDVNSITPLELRNILENEYPGLGNITYRIAVNGELDRDKEPIPEKAELALLPPFAGG